MKIQKNLQKVINIIFLFKLNDITQERILINFPSYLIALLPLSLISGPFLSDLSIVLIGIFFLINIILKKEYYFLKNKFIIIFSIFSLYLFINSLINYYDIHSIRSSLGYLRFGIFSLGVFYFLEKRKEIIKWLFIIFLICFLLLIFDGYYQYFNKVSFFTGNELKEVEELVVYLDQN